MSLDSLHAADLACKISLRLIATNEVVVYNKATDNPVLQKMVVSEAVKMNGHSRRCGQFDRIVGNHSVKAS